MSGRIETRAKKVSETLTIPFDFTGDLAAGETISSAAVTATVYSGVDASPSAIIDGSDTISGGVVTQDIEDGTLGVIYAVVCTATTSAARTLVKSTYVAIIPNLP